jgi:hypothetical protein
VVLLTSFMLDAGPTMVALIVLAIATVMIAMPPLQQRIAARQANARSDAGPDAGPDAGEPHER